MTGTADGPVAAHASSELTALFAELALREPARQRWLVVAAHPDDETLGASWILRRARELRIVHVTDGAPHERALWSPAAPDNRAAYAELRKRELEGALALCGIGMERVEFLGVVDQEATRALVDITLQLEQRLIELEPTIVLTHPYEGGHPDHDATAFAVQLAVRRIARRRTPPLMLEMACYQRVDERLRTGDFLPSPSRVAVRSLDAAERASKAEMLSCFGSQAQVIAAFSLESERFRGAPAYDFRLAPHTGTLHYEALGWPLTGEHWRNLAASALAQLEHSKS